MASGYFPLSQGDPYFEELKEAVEKLNFVLDNATYDDGQYDNAASDGGHLARLWLAKELILRALEV